jgi:hypothetical protein
MKLSKKSRRTIQRCLEDAQYQIDQLNKGFLRQADGTRLDVIEVLLSRVAAVIGGKHGRCRSERGVQETRGEG